MRRYRLSSVNGGILFPILAARKRMRPGRIMVELHEFRALVAEASK